MADETPTADEPTAPLPPDDADAVATEPPAAMSAESTELLDRLRSALGADAIVEAVESFGDLVVRVEPGAWRRAATVCKAQLGCDYLSFISGIDWMPAPLVAEEGSGDTSSPVQPREQTAGVAGAGGRFQAFARVASTHTPRYGITLKVDVDATDPHVESWVSVYPGADWHERECWEMYGFVFDGHPALRHLYLPTGFEGHPGRKDFPLLAREVKPWPGLVDVEGMPGEPAADDEAEASTP